MKADYGGDRWINRNWSSDCRIQRKSGNAECDDRYGYSRVNACNSIILAFASFGITKILHFKGEKMEEITRKVNEMHAKKKDKQRQQFNCKRVVYRKIIFTKNENFSFIQWKN